MASCREIRFPATLIRGSQLRGSWPSHCCTAWRGFSNSASREELLELLSHALTKAGNATLMTAELKDVLVDHAAGNYRLLMALLTDGVILTRAKLRELLGVKNERLSTAELSGSIRQVRTARSVLGEQKYPHRAGHAQSSGIVGSD